ncbi:hypothetical protein [Streptomyces sp. PT12]|nr:hypothetical protein [Streptomyces sp. PT12]
MCTPRTPDRTPAQRQRRRIIADASVGRGPDWYGPTPPQQPTGQASRA